MFDVDSMWQPEHQQQKFRLLLEAMSRPGQCFTLLNEPNAQLCMLSVLATVLDAEVTLSDPHDLLKDEYWLMLQAKPTMPEKADYLMCDASERPDFMPKTGTLASPEQSATLFLMVANITTHQADKPDLRLNLSGPGIEHLSHLGISGIRPEWFELRDECNSHFPMGIDMVFVDQTQLTALPRTTRVELA